MMHHKMYQDHHGISVYYFLAPKSGVIPRLDWVNFQCMFWTSNLQNLLLLLVCTQMADGSPLRSALPNNRCPIFVFGRICKKSCFECLLLQEGDELTSLDGKDVKELKESELLESLQSQRPLKLLGCIFPLWGEAAVFLGWVEGQAGLQVCNKHDMISKIIPTSASGKRYSSLSSSIEVKG